MKIIFKLFLLFIFIGTININSQLFDCIKNCDRIKQNCALDCIDSCECTSNCESNYVMTDCMEKCKCASKIKKCLEKCDQLRSDCTNCCINDLCLDPNCACSSCGMNF